MQYFPAVLTQAREGAVTLHVVDMPEVTCRGRDPAEAIARGQQALLHALGARAERNGVTPTPSPLDDRLFQRLDAEQRRDFKFFYLLAVSIAEPAVRLNVSLPGDLVRRIDAVAGNYGRSGWLAAAAREKLARGQEASGLSDDAAAFTPKPRAGRQKKPTAQKSRRKSRRPA
jgi:predicted RNase H-like HicB family nuclease